MAETTEAVPLRIPEARPAMALLPTLTSVELVREPAIALRTLPDTEEPADANLYAVIP